MADKDIKQDGKSSGVDKKAAKAAEKARKKEEKRRKKAGALVEDDMEEESGGKLAVFLVTIVIISIWLAILALLVKMDVGGFGSTVLSPLLKDVPYVNKILPVAEGEEMSTENTEYPYSTLDEAVARIKELEVQLQEAKNASDNSNASMQDLQQQVAQLEQYKAEEAAFEERKQKFDEKVVFSDKAPDINEYKTFYEGIEPENAEAIYKQVVEQVQKDEKMDEYVAMYSTMKPKQAAAIFDTMKDDLKLVANILSAMDSKDSANILGAMNTDLAAKLTKLMKPSE